MSIILRELTETDEEAFLDGLKEWAGEDPEWYSFIWKEGMTYSQMLTRLRKDVKGVDLAPGRVAHTMLYAFLDGKIIGRVSVRHELNDFLRHRGGHIGYAIAPKYRGKGYGRKIVEEGLSYCKKLGLDSIMITCADDNVGSWKIIEGFGGKLQDKIYDDGDQETFRRYWLQLS